MCGRYNIVTDAGAWVVATGELETILDLSGRKPRYNIAPSQQVPVVRASEDGFECVDMKWGLVPSWSKDAAIGNRLINARSETCAEKPAFRSAAQHTRCLLPASGWYEWQKTASGKQPFHVRRTDGSPLLFAGLWSRWTQGDAEPLDTCTILTREASGGIAAIHSRMPVVLKNDVQADWLSPASRSAADIDELLSGPETEFEAIAVSTLVNRPSNDDARCIEPIEGPS